MREGEREREREREMREGERQGNRDTYKKRDREMERWRWRGKQTIRKQREEDTGRRGRESEKHVLYNNTNNFIVNKRTSDNSNSCTYTKTKSA